MSGTNPAVTLLVKRKRRAPASTALVRVLGAAPVAWRRLHKRDPGRSAWAGATVSQWDAEAQYAAKPRKTCLRPTL